MADAGLFTKEVVPGEAASFLTESLGRGWEAHALAGDASVRQYFRIVTSSGERLMLCYYPEQLREDVRRFLNAYDAASSQTRIPRVVSHSSCAVLQEDIGDETLFDLLHRDREHGLPLYRQAVEMIVEFQRCPPASHSLNPPFDSKKFLDELEMTLQFYVEQLRGERRHRQRLQTRFAALAEKLTRHSYVLCHRDYHGQNLHIVNNFLYMIDYQDMRMGPDTYDLASLLRDRGVAQIIGAKAEAELVEHYRQISGADETLWQRYLETLLQRSIKIIGTFARQALTRGRTHYLDFIPPALSTVRFCLSSLPEFEDLAQVFPMNFEPHGIPIDSIQID